MHFIYVSHLLYRTVTKYVTADYSLHGQATLVNYAPRRRSCHSTGLGREEDKSKTMIDVLQEVKRCLGVETNL